MVQTAQCAFDFEIEAEIGVRDWEAGRQEAERGMQGTGNETGIKTSQTQRAEGVVTCKQFIAAVPAEGNGDMTARKAAEQPSG